MRYIEILATCVDIIHEWPSLHHLRHFSLKTIKQRGQGWSENFLATYQQGRAYRMNESVSLNYRTRGLDIFAKGYINHGTAHLKEHTQTMNTPAKWKTQTLLETRRKREVYFKGEIGSWHNISVVFHSRPLLEERIYFRMNRTTSVEDVLGVLNDMGIAKFELVGEKIAVASK